MDENVPRKETDFLVHEQSCPFLTGDFRKLLEINGEIKEIIRADHDILTRVHERQVIMDKLIDDNRKDQEDRLRQVENKVNKMWNWGLVLYIIATFAGSWILKHF